jgi:DNA repair photolyase
MKRSVGLNPRNKFDKYYTAREHEEGIDLEPDQYEQSTKYLDIYPKTIVNKVSSPDVNMDYSLNPYQGCEHGCAYCYARNSHQYWGYSAGLDFEQKSLVKKNTAALIRIE